MFTASEAFGRCSVKRRSLPNPSTFLRLVAGFDWFVGFIPNAGKGSDGSERESELRLVTRECAPPARMTLLALHKLVLPLILAISAATLPACGSTFVQKLQRTDGLFDFIAALAGESVEDALPVERVSNYSGQITTAHVKASPEGFRVSGLVGKSSLNDPPLGSHVDVLLLDAKQRVLESVTTRYQPRDIPTGIRGGFPHSRYTVRLRTLHPPAGSTVRIVFDSRPESVCATSRGS